MYMDREKERIQIQEPGSRRIPDTIITFLVNVLLQMQHVNHVGKHVFTIILHVKNMQFGLENIAISKPAYVGNNNLWLFFLQGVKTLNTEK